MSLQRKKTPSHYCGDSIISDRWILTAAHCVIGQSFYVRVGARHVNKGELVEIKQRILHQNYYPMRYDYDFGLIELKTALNFTDKIKPIPLPNGNDTSVATGTLCLVSGWGKTKTSSGLPEYLQGTQVPIFDQNDCARAYQNSRQEITSRMICAGFDKGGKDGKTLN